MSNSGYVFQISDYNRVVENSKTGMSQIFFMNTNEINLPIKLHNLVTSNRR